MSELPQRNVVRVTANGPYHLEGDLEVRHFAGHVWCGSEITLCRCGVSRSRGLCNGSHTTAGYEDEGQVKGLASHKPDPATATGPLVAKVTEEGPLIVEGSFDLVGETGILGFREGKAALCACGRSAETPLCDGTHTNPGS